MRGGYSGRGRGGRRGGTSSPHYSHQDDSYDSQDDSYGGQGHSYNDQDDSSYGQDDYNDQSYTTMTNRNDKSNKTSKGKSIREGNMNADAPIHIGEDVMDALTTSFDNKIQTEWRKEARLGLKSFVELATNLNKWANKVLLVVTLGKYFCEQAWSICTWFVKHLAPCVTFNSNQIDPCRAIRHFARNNAIEFLQSSSQASSAANNGNSHHACGSTKDKLDFAANSSTTWILYKRKFFCLVTENYELRLYSLGMRLENLQQFTQELYAEYLTFQRQKTITILTARKDKTVFQWVQNTNEQTPRAFSSIALPAKQKALILDWVTHSFSDEGRREYIEAGDPYRTGMLLYGKPGCGKSSVVTALASECQLKIYIIPLQADGMDDSNLQTLMTQTDGPKSGSLILFEDIDSAGVKRNNEKADKLLRAEILAQKKRRDLARAKSDKQHKDFPTPPASSDEDSSDEDSSDEDSSDEESDDEGPAISKVTLSGLLNVLDGVNAPIGTLIIMTTNKPEELDEALIRPGRCDLKIEFGYTCEEQLNEMFLNKYTCLTEGKRKRFELAEIEKLAQKFVEEVPANTFSPPEIKTLLRLHGQRPHMVFEDLHEWMAKTLKDRMGNTE